MYYGGKNMSEERWYSVKECAKLGKMSTQSIYKKLNHENNKDYFAGHIKTEFGKKYLDEYAVSLILKNRGVGNSSEPIIDEIIKITKQLNETNQKKVLNFAKQTLEVSKY